MKHSNKLCSYSVVLILAACAFFRPLHASAAAESAPARDSGEYEDFAGGWEYDGYSNCLRLDEDGTWVSLDSLGNIMGSGTYFVSRGGEAVLLDRADNEVSVLEVSGSGLTDSDGTRLTRADIPDQIGQPLEDYWGIWATDDGSFYFDFHENNRLSYYAVEDDELVYITDVTYEYADGGISARASRTVQQGYKVGEASFMLNSRGTLRDNYGTVFQRAELPEHTLPMPSDPLSDSITLRGSEKVVFPFPDLMDSYDEKKDSAFLYSPGWEEGLPDKFSQIEVLLVPIGNDYDDYMSAGQAVALRGMNKMAGWIMYGVYGDHMRAGALTNFENGGTYYQIMGTTMLDSSVYEEDFGSDLVGAMIIRYTGPTGYAQVISVMAPEESFTRYMQIACNMIAAMDADGGWTTAPTGEVPALEEAISAETAAGAAQPAAAVKTSVATSRGVRSGKGYDMPAPFYWTDADGDVWYWNGTDNVFWGYGDDYYIEDNGQVMESNDSGWAAEFEDWSDPGDMSDPGDTEDYYYADDSYEPGDYDDTNDYVESDYSEYGDSEYGEYGDYGYDDSYYESFSDYDYDTYSYDYSEDYDWTDYSDSGWDDW